MASPLLSRAALAFALCASAPAQQELYIHGPDGIVYRVDDYASNPTSVALGSTGLIGATLLTDMAVDPATGDFFFCAFGAPVSEFWRLDPVTLTGSLLPGTVTTNFYNALEIAGDGTMYARSTNSMDIASIDKVTGAETILSSAMPAPTAGDIATDLDGTLVATNNLGSLDRYDPVTGTITDLGPHGLVGNVFGIEIDTDGTIYLILENGDIYRHDLASSTSTLLGSIGLTVYGCAFKIGAGGTGPGFGTNYCTAVANSTGVPGSISALGSPAVSSNNVTLQASNLPTSQFGIFVVSMTQGFSPGAGGTSNGNICLSGTIGRFLGPGQILSTGTTGEFSLMLDLTAIPIGGSTVSTMAGDQLNFQAWHRDGVGLGSNFTDGIQLTFN